MVKKVSASKKATKKTAKKKASAKKKPTLAQRIAKAKKEAERAKDAAARQGEKLFKEAVREIFKKNKSLEKFSWPQYTPHWNDGDACEFSAHISSVSINEEVGGEDSEDIWTLQHIHELLSKKKKEEARILEELKVEKDKWKIDSLNRDLELLKTRDLEEVATKYKIKKMIIDLLESIDESAYENMFGEGLVVATRDGIEVEEYNHD